MFQRVWGTYQSSPGASHLYLVAAGTVPSRLGCLLQTAFRRARTCAALSRRLHSSRRHCQQPVVALANGHVTFRWRDSAHGNKKRLMTLPIEEFLRRFLLHLLPRGLMRIRNFGFLANWQRAKLLPLCFRLLQQFRSARSRHRLADHAPHSLTMELSAMRRKHAGCRASLHRATPPPIAASSQPVHDMNPHPQPRISLVLRRAHWLCVSHSSECSMVVRSRLSDAPPRDHSRCDPLLKPKRSDCNRKLANHQDRLIRLGDRHRSRHRRVVAVWQTRAV